MTEDETVELRKKAAHAARQLLDAARRGEDGNEVRLMIAAVCSRHGVANIVDLADGEPQIVIELWEGVELFQSQSYDAVVERAKP